MIHLLMRHVAGVLALYDTELTDAQFDELVKQGWPNDWTAMHFNEDETVDDSERARTVAKMPRIVCFNKGSYFNERVEYGESVWGGAALQFSAPMADVIQSFKTALLVDRVLAFLPTVRFTQVPSNHDDCFKPLLAAVQTRFPELDLLKDVAPFAIFQWLKEQPGYVKVDMIELRMAARHKQTQ